MQELEVSLLTGSNSASAEKGLLLLIVDDDPSQRLLARYALEREGYHILEADSGLACLEAASRYQPDIVLLDAVMPGLDGFECCRRLHAQNPDMPILIVTALEDEAFVNEAFAAGASDYIPKPIHWSVLKRRLHHLLQVSQAQRRLQQLNQELEAKVKERTAQLACQIADLEQLNRLKDHFLAAVSHELRTPSDQDQTRPWNSWAAPPSTGSSGSTGTYCPAGVPGRNPADRPPAGSAGL
jgi:PleD family two-component response regulator